MTMRVTVPGLSSTQRAMVAASGVGLVLFAGFAWWRLRAKA
jgi:hypothetical protein